MPVVDGILLLDTGSVSFAQAAFLNVIDPSEMVLERTGINSLLESDDIFSWDDFPFVIDRCSKSSREQSSKEESKISNVDHVENGKE